MQFTRLPILLFCMTIMHGHSRSETDFPDTVSISCPGVLSELKTFLEYEIGMERRRFRNWLPTSWKPSDMMFSHEQGVNLAGDYDPYFFEYHLETCLGRPAMSFLFWQDMLIKAEALAVTRDPQDRSLFDLATAIYPLLTLRFGQPFKDEESMDRRVIEWKGGDVSASVRVFAKDPADRFSIGSITVAMESISRERDMHAFRSKPAPPSEKTGVRLTSIYCKRGLRSGAIFEIVLTTDTRMLTEEVSTLVAQTKKSGLEEAGVYACEFFVLDNRGDEYEGIFKGHPLLSTFLHFIDGDGLANVITFLNTPAHLEDVVCSSFLSEFQKSARSARCVVGNALTFTRDISRE